MRTDADIRREVESELRWDPSINDTRIEDIQITIPLSGVRTDTGISEAAANALQWDISLSHTVITPDVKDGWVTLSGHVSWGHQCVAAENAVRSLMGVKGITNDIYVLRA
jgi:osmotically-inducible protein OsmY